jgi:hypothetical protein
VLVLQLRVISNETWKMLDTIRDKNLEEIRERRAAEDEDEEDKDSDVLFPQQFL